MKKSQAKTYPLLQAMRWLALAALLLAAALLMLRPAAAQQGTSFDHQTTGFSLTGKHEDTRCESCHIKGIFKGTPKDCASCHVQNNSRGAVAKSVKHFPTTAACDSCHSTSAFSAVLFSHAGVAPGSCASCHNNFNVQGKSAGHIPTTASCDQCHGTTAFRPAGGMPTNHIPFSATAQCTACHTSTDFSVMPTVTAIHANAPSTTTNCAQCHGAAAPSFAIPASGFSIVGLPANHIPSSASCEVCHVGAGSSIAALPVVDGARFTGSRMSHQGITNNCVTCHAPSGSASSFVGIASIVGMPPTSPVGAGSHIPSSTTCESCHLGSLANVSGLIAPSATRTAPGTLFATPVPTSAQIHTGVTGNCNACHDTGSVWMGMANYPISPSTFQLGARYTGFQTRPVAAASTYSVPDRAHPSTGDCSQCHTSTSYFDGAVKPANHIPTAATAQCTACHTSGDFSVLPTVTNIHANAPSTTTNCAQCHGAAAPSFAIPAANFSIVGLPNNHIPTSASCEVCHVGSGSSIATLPVVDGARFTGSRMSHQGITNNCVACHTASGSTASFAGITAIVGMPPTSRWAWARTFRRTRPARAATSEPWPMSAAGARECHPHRTGHACSPHRPRPRRRSTPA